MSADADLPGRLEDVLGRLEGVKRAGAGYMARCPAHDDRCASLSVAAGEGGRVLLFCQAGCKTADVSAALGLSLAELMGDARGSDGGKAKIVATYDYRDESGVLLYQVVRFDPKSFRQRRPKRLRLGVAARRRAARALPPAAGACGRKESRDDLHLRGREGRRGARARRMRRDLQLRRCRQVAAGVQRGAARRQRDRRRRQRRARPQARRRGGGRPAGRGERSLCRWGAHGQGRRRPSRRRPWPRGVRRGSISPRRKASHATKAVRRSPRRPTPRC